MESYTDRKVQSNLKEASLTPLLSYEEMMEDPKNTILPKKLRLSRYQEEIF